MVFISSSGPLYLSFSSFSIFVNSIVRYEASEILVLASFGLSLTIHVISSLNSMRLVIEASKRALIPLFGLTPSSAFVLVSASSNKASLTQLFVSYTSCNTIMMLVKMVIHRKVGILHLKSKKTKLLTLKVCSWYYWGSNPTF